MQAVYHVQITDQALRRSFSQHALAVITAANLGQDSLRGQIGHPEYHFDDNNFLQGTAYIRLQRQLIHQALEAQTPEPAWQAFGRLTHGAQDFYAHSNYVRLWFERQQQLVSAPQVETIEPLDQELLLHPGLVSGRIYLPWEILSYIPLLGLLMHRLLPADSHTHMNLDTPQRGPLFPFAVEAARKRTEWEFATIQTEILGEGGANALHIFTDLDKTAAPGWH